MGRGQPLPPPGMPLPGPPGQKSLWGASGLNIGMGGMKRKPIAPALPPRRDEQQKKTPPPLPARRQSAGQGLNPGVEGEESQVGDGDSLLVVAAPEEEEARDSAASSILEATESPEHAVPMVDEVSKTQDLADLPIHEESEHIEQDVPDARLGPDHATTESKSTETIGGKEGVAVAGHAGDVFLANPWQDEPITKLLEDEHDPSRHTDTTSVAKAGKQA